MSKDLKSLLELLYPKPPEKVIPKMPPIDHKDPDVIAQNNIGSSAGGARNRQEPRVRFRTGKDD